MADLRTTAQFGYNNAMIVGKLLSIVLSGKGKIEPVEQLYPKLYNWEPEEATPQNDKEFQQAFAGFKAFAQAYNIQHKGGRNDNRRTQNKG